MNIQKQDMIMSLTGICRYGDSAALLRLTPAIGFHLPEIAPGQFVNVLIEGVDGVMLRRPISVNYVDRINDELWLLVKNAGRGTAALCDSRPGQLFRILLPLGRGFSMPPEGARPLLAGGGIGTAPMLYWGRTLADAGFRPVFLLGARSATELLQLEYFEKIGEVLTATDDGSLGHHGVVTTHPGFISGNFTHIYACGPMPMLKAIAEAARNRNMNCEVSLENKMACGLGACLCCVENTTTGNRCTCTDGPVFNINELTW